MHLLVMPILCPPAPSAPKLLLLWCAQVWPLLVDYFYRDTITISQDNVCALLALSRQLLVAPVCQYCTEFVAQHLTTANCIAYLRQAEKYQLHDIQQQAVVLAAQGVSEEGVHGSMHSAYHPSCWDSQTMTHCVATTEACIGGGRVEQADSFALQQVGLRCEAKWNAFSCWEMLRPGRLVGPCVWEVVHGPTLCWAQHSPPAPVAHVCMTISCRVVFTHASL